MKFSVSIYSFMQYLNDGRLTPFDCFQKAKDMGFDAIAGRIYRFEEVKSVYLMSGSYDLLVLVEARTLKELALFVSEKLSPLDTVTGTATSFVLKRYKQDGVIFVGESADKRMAVSP